MGAIKIASMMFTWNGVGDRFLSKYFEPQGIENIFPIFEGSCIKGVELQHPRHVNKGNIDRVRELLNKHKLEPVIVNIPMASDIQWVKGTFSNNSAEIRARAVERVKDAIDTSRLLGVNKVSLFLGQDGFDYPLSSNYRKAWENLVQSFCQVADYAPDIRFCIEYKPCEPRSYQYLNSAAKTLLLAEETGKKNIGLLMDIGHAWMARENMGEVISLAAHKKRLFHIHFNDNYRCADDDLGVGGVHFSEYLEALFWLREIAYEEWISLDVHSPRENSGEIILQSARFLQNIDMLIERTGYLKLKELVDHGDGAKLMEFMNSALFSNM